LNIDSVRIHPAALDEAEAAVDWYAQRSRRAAQRFLDQLDGAIDQIARNPSQCAQYEFGTRRMVLRRFPFAIVFREASAGIEIIAVAHSRRRPGYWQDRLE
jgi:plasmid stabilization system protein ParE